MSIKGIGINIHSGRINGDLQLLEQDLRYFATCGFDYAEIPAHGVDAIFGGQLCEPRVRRVVEILSDLPFRYTVHAPDPLNLFDATYHDLQKDVFRATIAFAQRIRAEAIVYHAGRLDFTNERSGRGLAELKAMEREALREMGDLAAAAGIVIGVENGDTDSYSSDITQLVAQVQETAHPAVGITFDLGHAFLTVRHHKQDFLEMFRLAAPLIATFHVHDNFGLDVEIPFSVPYIYTSPFGIGDMHLPPGWGKIPFEQAFASLRTPPAVLTIELQSRFADLAPQVLQEVRRLAALTAEERAA